ncbi:glycoside hydrolase family 32 protein [Microbacterium sp. No. 7]|uniref:glycoside hydrolase family 32 protein n=1 Tax=Microbacterium sp. No. 7 TaxID=1714373 RepID=UPI003007F380
MTTNTTPARLARAAPRPRVHFAPRRNWMNDPNGLVHHDGIHHLFFQYNPEGTDWGNMSWGHATSEDLVTWTEHEVALRYDDDAQIFSGSIVSDVANTSGFGTDGRGPLVALYTAAAEHGQSQALAWSPDDGATWTKYGVVLDRGTADFRDPKVFRHEDAWIMVTVEAVDRQIHLYRSEDLRSWHHLSVFGPEGPTEGVWECPDLFALDGAWVLTLSVNPGHPTGGSGMLAFVGDFDGVRFTADRWHWLDHGSDYYAGVTFSGLDRPVMMAWLNNWAYAHELPEATWRGSMALPRLLSLRDGRVIQQPAVAPAEVLRFSASDVALDEEGWELPEEGLQTATRLRLTLVPGDDVVEISLRGRGQVTALPEIRLTYAAGQVTLERDGSDMLPGLDAFSTVARTEVALTDHGTLDVEIWIDADSVEVFAAAGAVTLSVLTLADYGRQQLVVRGRGDGHAVLSEIRAAELLSGVGAAAGATRG